MNLLSLLGQAASASGMLGADQVNPEDEKFARDGIVVQGANRVPADDAAAPADAGPPPVPRRVFSDRSKLVPPTKDQEKEIVPRHGAFGVKGTLRDVLGILGDSMLMASGQKGTYLPKRAEEKDADALYGITDGPAAQREAIERYIQRGHAKDGAALFNQYQTQQYQQDSLHSQDEARKALDNDRQFTNKNQGTAAMQRAVAQGKTPEQRARIVAHYGPMISQRVGVPLEDLGIYEGMTDDDLVAYGDSDMNVYQSRQLPMQQARVNQGQERIDHTEQVDARKEKGGMFDRPPPRPGPQPRAQTPLEYFKELQGVPAAKRTPEQRSWIKKYSTGGKGSRLDGLPPPPPKGGAANRFTIKRTN